MSQLPFTGKKKKITPFFLELCFQGKYSWVLELTFGYTAELSVLPLTMPSLPWAPLPISD